MKNRLILVGTRILGLLSCGVARAVTSEHSSTDGLVTVSNRTSSAVWKPKAVFVPFPSTAAETAVEATPNP